MKDSNQIAIETGMSRERVNQAARSIGVKKIGGAFVWNERQEKLFISRIGKRGDKLKKRRK